MNFLGVFQGVIVYMSTPWIIPPLWNRPCGAMSERCFLWPCWNMYRYSQWALYVLYGIYGVPVVGDGGAATNTPNWFLLQLCRLVNLDKVLEKVLLAKTWKKKSGIQYIPIPVFFELPLIFIRVFCRFKNENFMKTSKNITFVKYWYIGIKLTCFASFFMLCS
jgi:hypothetical protein